MNDEDRIRQRFQELSDAYKARLPALLAQLKVKLITWFESGAPPEALEEIHFQIHKLSGTGASFGLNSVSVYSKKIENILLLIMQGQQQPDQPGLEQILEWLEAMIAASRPGQE